MAKTLRDYFADAKQDYLFHLKFAFEPSKEQLDAFKRKMNKYGIKSLEFGEKSIIKPKDNDFPRLNNVEVWHYTLKTEYPTTPELLIRDIIHCFKTNEMYINVRTDKANRIVDRQLQFINKEEKQEVFPKDEKDMKFEVDASKREPTKETKENEKLVGDARVADLIDSYSSYAKSKKSGKKE